MLPEMACKLFDNMNWGDTERNISAHINMTKCRIFQRFQNAFKIWLILSRVSSFLLETPFS